MHNEKCLDKIVKNVIGSNYFVSPITSERWLDTLKNSNDKIYVTNKILTGLLEKKNLYMQGTIPYIQKVINDEIKNLKNEKSELEKLATVDSLTGLFNRRRCLENLNRELKRSVREKKPLSVIMCDLDYFKSINDTYGHDAGDSVLKTISGVAKNHFRGTDILCRIGGEEFLIILPNTAKTNAIYVAERLRKDIEEQPIKIDSQDKPIYITTSIGIYQAKENETIETIMKNVDLKLYDAKKSGRNKVCSE
ncbi:MAG TPA: GGDEF domain-containing protein [Candidatus Nanoarchaeia archaeon]|nr:GGDEF domain-containing protein [Candidatus Nanoarchaeia archaeon]